MWSPAAIGPEVTDVASQQTLGEALQRAWQMRSVREVNPKKPIVTVTPQLRDNLSDRCVIRPTPVHEHAPDKRQVAKQFLFEKTYRFNVRRTDHLGVIPSAKPLGVR